jgi:hypothetical protein
MVESLAKKIAELIGVKRPGALASKPPAEVQEPQPKAAAPKAVEKEPVREGDAIPAEPAPKLATEPRHSAETLPKIPPVLTPLEKKRHEPIWQSERLPSEIRGLGLGNLKNKGSKDLILLTRQSLMLYEIKENGLRFQREFRKDPEDLYLRVDVWDAEKGDGYLIFLTNWKKNQVRSLVLHVGPNGVRTLGEDLGWFFRILEIPGLGTRLIAQKFDPKLTFGGPVALLVNKNGRLTEGEQLRLPPSANLYNFNFLQTENDTGILVHGEDGLLRLYSSDARLTWASKESYPGSTQYILRGKSPIFGRTMVRKNNGGRPEFLVYHNRGALLRSGSGRDGSGLFGLIWAGNQLAPLWETTSLDGEISDFQIGDIDNETGEEMVIASLLRPERGSKKPSSVLTVFKLR